MLSFYEYTPNPHINVSQVLNTVFWLGKAASGCASYSGPSLNLKEFEGLLAQMKVVSEHSEGDRVGGWGWGGSDRNTESGIEEVRGMDLLVSCLCWSAEETHETEDKHFCFCYTAATSISGRDRKDKQEVS